MDDQIINIQNVNILIKNSSEGIMISQFKDVNTIVQDETIVSMLYKLGYIDICRLCKILCNEHVLLDIADIGNKLRININRLLAHQDIDFSIITNKWTLISMIMNDQQHYLSENFIPYLHINNETLDKILKFHKINPDILMGDNSIKKLLGGRLDRIGLAEKIDIFINHGANLELDVDSQKYRNQPYIMALQNLKIFDTVAFHTKNFYCLGNLFFTPFINVLPIFEHILQYGKFSSLQYLDKDGRENIKKYDHSLKNIQKLDSVELIQQTQLIRQSKNVDNIVRKICIFKQNLEHLTKNIITVPAYRFYDIAIILFFLIKYPQLTVLSQDILRLITFFVFNF